MGVDGGGAGQAWVLSGAVEGRADGELTDKHLRTPVSAQHRTFDRRGLANGIQEVSDMVQATARVLSQRSKCMHSCAICTTQRSCIVLIYSLLTSFPSDPQLAFDLYNIAIKHFLDMFTPDKLSQRSFLRLRSVS